MKFKTGNKGDCRKKRFFAWLPITIENETRWLEFVEVEQCWKEIGSSGCKELYTHQYVFGWENLKFINK